MTFENQNSSGKIEASDLLVTREMHIGDGASLPIGFTREPGVSRKPQEFDTDHWVDFFGAADPSLTTKEAKAMAKRYEHRLTQNRIDLGKVAAEDTRTQDN